MESRASTRTRLSVLPVFISLLLNLILPTVPLAGTMFAANDGIVDYAQCQIADGAGLDCAAPPETPSPWTNGILNDTHNDYAEDEVVPQRLQMEFEAAGQHTVTIRYMTRKDSSGQRHAYDYLATWNHTYVNADRCQALPSGVDCIGGSPSTLAIPSDPNSVSPGGPQPTSAHEAGVARNFVMYGGTLVSATTPVHAVDPSEDGSDYASITVTFDVGAGGEVQLLWGGHLASGFGPRGWGENLGAAAISGGPYHMIVDAIDGESIGQRDNQIMSNAIEPLLPALTIVKTPDGGAVNAGEYASFTITVTNNGPGAATNVDIDDDLPEGPAGTNTGLVWEEFPDKAECTIVSNNLHCDIASLADDASFAVTVRALTDSGDCGTLNNTAFADADNNSQVSDTGSVNVNCPSIRVAKTPDESTGNPGANDIQVGSAATFTVTVFNDGAGTANGVTLFDDLPGTGWSVDASNTTLTSCAVTDPSTGEHADKGEILSCGPDTINASSSKKVTVTKTTATADCGEINNTASASSTNDGSGSDSGNIDVLCPQIRVEKEPDEGDAGSTVNAGDTATFTVTVFNDGAGTANGVTVFDDLPGTGWSVDAANTTLSSCTVTDPSTGEHADKGEILTCGPDTISASSSKKVTVTNPISAGECDDLPNSATASSTNDGNDTDTGLIEVTCPEIRIEKTPDENAEDTDANDITVGDDATFTITVHNDGDGVANGVNLFDDLPGTGWSVDAANTTLTGCSVTDPSTGEHADKGEILTCGPDTINASSSKKVTVTKTTSFPGDCGELNNTASATSTNDGADSDAGNIDVLCPDLEIEKTTSTPVVNAGGTASYTITVSNEDGEGDAIGVDISDTLPAGLTWTDNSLSCSIVGNLLSCNDLTIPAGGSFSVTVTGATDSGDCPSILNRATFTSDNAGSGASASEGQGTLITVNCPDLEVVKEQVDANGDPSTDPVSAGETAYFAIHVTNHGPGTASDVDVLDFAPDGTVWTVEDDGGFDCPTTIDDAGDSCTADSMAPGTATIILSYDTDLPDCGQLENNVEVSASNEPLASVGEDNESSATITVECPGLNIAKEAVADPIDAGEVASFTIVVWNTGPGTAFDVTLTDDLPGDLAWSENSTKCSITSGVLSCDFGDLGVTTKEASTARVTLTATTDRSDCGILSNTAIADSTPGSPVESSDSITVKCPTVAVEKDNNQPNPVLPGTNVTFTVKVTISDGPAENVVVVDTLPTGYAAPTNISNSGSYASANRTITWNLGTVGTGSVTLTYQAAVNAGVAHGTQLVNTVIVTSSNSQCPSASSLAPECDDTSTVNVRVPTLVIDKVASTETITITGPNNALVATPSVVTWTLSYTLTNGPVTNAVITDPVPAGFTFLDASNGGALVGNSVTWNLGTLSTSGSVNFRTTVNPATISRVAPTVNIATIDSSETAPDQGQDSVTVAVIPPPLAGNPTPPPLPNTAIGFGSDGTPVTVPIELLAVLFIGSLGALTLANARARSRRQ